MTDLAIPTAADPLDQDGLFTPPAPERNDQDAPAPGTATGDPDAPYGFTEAGTPRRKPGRKPGPAAATTAGPRKPPAKKVPPPPAPKKAGTPKPPPSKAATSVDYRPAVTKLVTEVAGALAVGGVVKRDTALVADAAVVEMNAPVLAELANQAADTWPVVGAVLDRMLKVAPVAGGIGSLALMLGQIGVNHGLIPAGLIPGTVAPGQLMDTYLRTKMEADSSFAATMQSIFQAQAQAADAEHAAAPAA